MSNRRASALLARLRGERTRQLDGDEVLARDDAAPGEVGTIAVALAHREIGCSASAQYAIAAVLGRLDGTSAHEIGGALRARCKGGDHGLGKLGGRPLWRDGRRHGNWC